ncbi:DUF1801 domain-containing protein [Bailinhaonella thermotolerans]|nr:DUF1801 domain-containing protein [Bailinhaonella thermotolerans]
MPEASGAEVEELLRGHEAGVVETALWVRGVVRAAMPDAQEKVWPGWHGFGYHHPGAGYVCGVFPRERAVSLFFEYGERLPDPARILTPSGRRGRSVVLDRPGQVPEDRLTALIDAAVELRRG